MAGQRLMGDGKALVGARVDEAWRAARRSEAEFRELSKVRLASLKTLPPARLARLGHDPELTDADQKELQNFIANRTKASGRRGGLSSKVLRWRLGGRRPSISTKIVVAVNVALLAAAGVAGWRATPPNYQVVEHGAAILIGDLAGPRERVILPAGTVVRYEGDAISQRARPIQLWVEGWGYRSTIYHADP